MHTTGWKTALLLAALAAVARPAAALDATESWTEAGTAGWTNSSPGASLSNPGGYLNIRFAQQALPMLVENRASVEIPAGVLLTNLNFRFAALDTPPSSLRVVLTVATNGHVWLCNLPRPAVGNWGAISVPLTHSPDWFLGLESDPAVFNADMRRVSSVAVFLRRHGSPAKQDYGLDDFTLQGLAISPDDRDADGMPDDWEGDFSLDADNPGDADDDADEDGMLNYAEYRAGTNPRDPDSVFVLDIEAAATPPGVPVEGVVLRWRSISNRTYAVWHAVSLATNTFDQVGAGVPATPPENQFVAPVSSNAPAGFFRIEVE